MLPTRLPRVVVVALAVFGVACGDPTKPAPSYVNAPSTYTLFALSGAPPTAATAVSLLGGAVHANAAFAFDLAFDLDPTGNTRVYPVRQVGGALANLERAYLSQSTLQRVGLQQLPGPFDAVREVPTAGYDTTSYATVAPGAVLAVEVLEPSCFYSLGGQTISAKLTVDSVNTTTRRIFLRTVVDPNCGYRSVVPDSLPTS
jgi:hypothetical protein